MLSADCDWNCSEHAEKRKRERNFDDRDIERVLWRGLVTDVQWHHRQHCWVYKLEGHDVEGVDLVLIVQPVISEHLLRIVTGE
jgi:hypothetical protein